MSADDQSWFDWTNIPSHTDDYVTPTVMELVARHRPATILDAGCGNGSLAGQLAAAGYRVTGVDGDANGIAIATRRFADVTFHQSLFNAPPPGTFDLVCSTEVIEHLYDPDELARYCHAALRPGGTLIISAPYHGYLKNLVLSVLGKWDQHFTALDKGYHIKFFSRRTLTALLERNGFAVTGFRGVGRVAGLWKSMILIARRLDE